MTSTQHPTTDETSEKFAEFPLTDGGTVVVGAEQIGISERIVSFRAIRFHADGYGIERGEWRDTAAMAMADGLRMAGWLDAVTAVA